MDLVVRPEGFAEWRGRRLRCAVGRGGVRRDKREGDGATPTGAYRLLRVLFRGDRGPPPLTVLPAAAIDPSDGWCDAPGDPAYNQPVRLPYNAGAETLWRHDGLYDVLAVTDHNANPVVAGLGSAIFLHVARPDFGPTEGCVAFALPDLQAILSDWRPGDRLRIEAG